MKQRVFGCIALFLLAASARAEPTPVDALNREQRLADLRHLAAQIASRHPAPYEATARETFERRIEELGKGIETLDASGFFFRLSEAAALVDDIHTSVFPLEESGLLLTTYPIRLRQLDDGLYVRAAGPENRELVGARIESFAGIPAPEVIARVRALVPGNRRISHANVPLAYLLCPDTFRYLGIGGAADPLRVAVTDRHGVRRDVELRAERTSLMAAYESGDVVGWRTPPGWVSLFDVLQVEAPLFLRRRGEMAWFEPAADGKALLVQINQPRPDAGNTVLSFAARLYSQLLANRYERIVIDLRGNEGGWYVLTNALAGIIASIEPLNHAGRVFVLIGPDTASAGVVLATQLELGTEALFIGEPTGSSPNFYATYRPEALPHSGIYYRISSERHVLSLPEDGRPVLRPDLVAPERMEDLRKGRDLALDKALAFDPASAPEPLPWYRRWQRAGQ